MQNTEALTARQVHKLLLKRRGAMTRIADSIGVNRSFVTLVLQGNKGGRVGRDTAQRILGAAHVVANDIAKELSATENGAN